MVEFFPIDFFSIEYRFDFIRPFISLLYMLPGNMPNEYNDYYYYFNIKNRLNFIFNQTNKPITPFSIYLISGYEWSYLNSKTTTKLSYNIYGDSTNFLITSYTLYNSHEATFGVGFLIKVLNPYVHKITYSFGNEISYKFVYEAFTNNLHNINHGIELAFIFKSSISYFIDKKTKKYVSSAQYILNL